MTGDSDDEFGDGQSLEYNEDLETQLQLIESQLPVHHANGQSITATSIPAPSDRAPATRRKIEHLDICLEEEVADDEAVDNLIGEDDQTVLDVLNAPASQSSRYEEDLVQQVTNLIPGATVDAEPTTNGITTESTPVNGVSHELMDVNEGDEAEGKRKKSLFERFRKRGFFSVTDLVAPSWCEVQVCIYPIRIASLLIQCHIVRLVSICNALDPHLERRLIRSPAADYARNPISPLPLVQIPSLLLPALSSPSTR
jgi:hypothetical protein